MGTSALTWTKFALDVRYAMLFDMIVRSYKRDQSKVTSKQNINICESTCCISSCNWVMRSIWDSSCSISLLLSTEVQLEKVVPGDVAGEYNPQFVTHVTIVWCVTLMGFVAQLSWVAANVNYTTCGDKSCKAVHFWVRIIIQQSLKQKCERFIRFAVVSCVMWFMLHSFDHTIVLHIRTNTATKRFY